MELSFLPALRSLWSPAGIGLHVGDVCTCMAAHSQRVLWSHQLRVFESRVAHQEEDCELGLLARAGRDLSWTTSYLEPRFSHGITFDAKSFCPVRLGVVEQFEVGGDREKSLDEF